MSRHVVLAVTVASLLAVLVSVGETASNLNLSKSNINRLVWDPGVVTAAQAAAILAELDKTTPGGALDETTVRAIVDRHVHGSKAAAKPAPTGSRESARTAAPSRPAPTILVRPAAGPGVPRSVFILASPADEKAAIAVSDPGAEGPKPAKASSSR
jgi:hypothetical protein